MTWKFSRLSCVFRQQRVILQLLNDDVCILLFNWIWWMMPNKIRKKILRFCARNSLRPRTAGLKGKSSLILLIFEPFEIEAYATRTVQNCVGVTMLSAGASIQVSLEFSVFWENGFPDKSKCWEDVNRKIKMKIKKGSPQKKKLVSRFPKVSLSIHALQTIYCGFLYS